MNKISYFILVLIVSLSSGCARKFTYDCQPNNRQEVNFTIVDSRPDIEKKGEALSTWVGNKNYGIFRLGDDQLIPDRLQFLTDKLTNGTNSLLSGKTIIIKHFEIFNNQQKALRKIAGFSSFGVIGAVALSATDDDEAYIEANLEMLVDDKPYSSKARHGYILNKWTTTDETPQLKMAMNDVVADIIKSIKYTHSNQ